MNASVKSFLRRALASAGAAMAFLGAGAAHAAVYEYSFSGWVNHATSSGTGSPTNTAFGLSSGSLITGTLWFDASAPQTQDSGWLAHYDAGVSSLSITGLDLSGPSNLASYSVVNSSDPSPGQYDSLNHFAQLGVPNGTLDMRWFVAAPTSWLASAAMPNGLPVSDLLLQHSGGSLSFNGAEGFGSQSLQFRFTAISPVPEPSTYALMLAGLALVGGVAARRGALRVGAPPTAHA